MRDQDQRRAALGVQCEHEIDHLGTGRRVEITGRLVRQQQRGSGDESPRNGDALLFAARKLSRVVMEPCAETHAFEHLRRGSARAADAREFQRQHRILEGRHRRQQLKGLEDEADLPGAHRSAPVLVELIEIDAIDFDGPARRRVEPRQQTEQRRLAGTRHPHDSDCFAAPDVETHVRKYGQMRIRSVNFAPESLHPHDRLVVFSLMHIRRLLFLLLFVGLVPPTPAAAPRPAILVFGDSLSAGYGVPRESTWAALLARKLEREGARHTVVNASLSGETTAGGLRRFDEALRTHQPGIVILELGANDGLRGLPLDVMQRNLETMITKSRSQGATVLLVGMRLPPNYGKDYTEKFHASYLDLARRHRLALVPFLFEGFAERRELFQPDAVHPTAEAQPLMLETIWKALQPLLKR